MDMKKRIALIKALKFGNKVFESLIEDTRSEQEYAQEMIEQAYITNAGIEVREFWEKKLSLAFNAEQKLKEEYQSFGHATEIAEVYIIGAHETFDEFTDDIKKILVVVRGATEENVSYFADEEDLDGIQNE